MALICSGDHRCSSRSCTQPRSRWFPASFAVFGRRARNPARACAATARQPRWLLFRPISRLTVDAARPSRAAITRSRTPAATPTATSSRSATDRYRPPGGPGGPFPFTPPAARNQPSAVRSTPAATAASRTPSPARIPSQKASRATRGTGNRPRLFTTTSTISRNRCDDQLNPPWSMRPQPTVIMELRPGARGRCEPLAAFPAPQPHSRRHTGMVSQRIRTRVRVTGIVQGVGFRPFVYSLATGLGLGGLVGNDVDGVFAEVEGAPEAVEKFMVALSRDAPPLASVERIATSPLRPQGSTVFSIARSQPGGERRTLVSADTATCDDCLAELADPADRRFGYPFLNCTNCGPRFTIVTGVPYDRALTTMAGFAMCGPCAAEYHDPANRRFHAQPTCCPGCGPRLRLVDHTGASLFVDPVVDPVVDPAVDPVEGAADLLARGGVLAVKGLGGYHLAADAAS